MDKDIAFGFRLLLAFVVYGLANYWGQVGRFLPPVVIDLPVVLLAGVWLFCRPNTLNKKSLPLLLFLTYVGIIGWFDNVIRVFLSASFNVEFPLVETTPFVWKIFALSCLLGSVALFAWQHKHVLINGNDGPMLRAKFAMFSITQLIWPVLLLFNVHFAGFHIISWLITISLMFGMSNVDQAGYANGLRFLVIYWLLLSFDLLQWISLELLM